MLVERNGCIFDQDQLDRSFGHEGLDAVGQEAFVNHVHVDGPDRELAAQSIIEGWKDEMTAKWPGVTFKIYLHRDQDEVIVRFHRHHPEIGDWCTGAPGLTIITVGE